jgi:hypothetical protein
MLIVEQRPELGMAVVVIAPPGSDEDWTAYAAAIDQMNRSAPRTERPVLLQVLRRNLSVPSPLVRKRLGELRARIRHDAINVIVAESAAIRGVQTALDWLRKPDYDSSTHPDAASAIAHVERVIGRAVPELVELHAAAMRRATAAK